MDNLSSHSLFHFTHTEETLKKILLKGLRFSPIGESIPGTKLYYVVDAICFCDIPLTATLKHVEWYGSYGIGFSPTYCKSIGATPVCYVHSGSKFLYRGKSKNLFYRDWNLTPYLKRTCGKQTKHHCHKMYWKEFYDEKEWRSIEQDSLTLYSAAEVANLSSLKRVVDDEREGRAVNDYHCPVCFNYDDVRYIILPTKKDIPGFIQWMNHNKLPIDLQRRIITIEEISKDF